MNFPRTGESVGAQFHVNPLTSDTEIPPAVVRLVRRVCLLRERGDAGAAAARGGGRRGAALVGGGLAPAALASVYAREVERAAEAVAIGEMLLEQLRGPLARPAVERTAAAAPAPRAPAPRPEGAPAIADLLDAMLAGEAAARRV